MSRSGEIILAWGAEDHTFRLGLKEWAAIDEACKVGPQEMMARLLHVGVALKEGASLSDATSLGLVGRWRANDVREVILQGLIGGGLSPIQAGKLVRERIDDRLDFRVNVALAFGIVKASLDGIEAEPLGEPKAAETTGATSSPTDGSASPPSSGPEPS